MGLDTTHGCYNGSYSHFHFFRKQLGFAIGINIEDYWNFGGDKDPGTIDHKIAPLLNHSDCDGHLTVDECKSIADGLEEIIPSLEDQRTAIQFRNGLLLAISRNETVEFR